MTTPAKLISSNGAGVGFGLGATAVAVAPRLPSAQERSPGLPTAPWGPARPVQGHSSRGLL